jgi:hypothetical protein
MFFEPRRASRLLRHILHKNENTAREKLKVKKRKSEKVKKQVELIRQTFSLFPFSFFHFNRNIQARDA